MDCKQWRTRFQNRESKIKEKVTKRTIRIRRTYLRLFPPLDFLYRWIARTLRNTN